MTTNPSAPETAARKRRDPLPPLERRHKPFRKLIHLICFGVFVALPFSNLMRFDIPRQRFYLAGFELWISEFSILFFTLMLLMFLVAASAILYGRIYCSYACPQMIFSEASQGLDRWIDRKVKQRVTGALMQKVVSRSAFYALLLGISIFLAFVFTSYFVEPRDLLRRLVHFDLVTAGGITGATVTLFTFLDFAFVRQRFCTTVCPYGYLQGMLQDGHTLLVKYEDPEGACIQCGKCVRVCEMGIDIRTGPYQIECVHCGDCVDACEDVLRRLGHPGLIQYAYGEKAVHEVKPSLLRRLGFRDAKRVVIALILVVYAAALGTALALRRPVLVYVASDRTTLYDLLPDGRVSNRVRIKVANRSSRATEVRFWVEGLPGAELGLPQNPMPLAAGASVEQTVALTAPRRFDEDPVIQIRMLAQAAGDRSAEITELTFIMPPKGK